MNEKPNIENRFITSILSRRAKAAIVALLIAAEFAAPLFFTREAEAQIPRLPAGAVYLGGKIRRVYQYTPVTWNFRLADVDASEFRGGQVRTSRVYMWLTGLMLNCRRNDSVLAAGFMRRIAGGRRRVFLAILGLCMPTSIPNPRP